MALAANALTTVSQVSSYLTLGTLSGSAQTDMEFSINAASAFLEEQCKTTFGKTDYTNESHEGSGSSLLIPLHGPLISVTSIVDEEATVITDYIIKHASLLYRKLGWSVAQTYNLTYSAGYVLPQFATEQAPRTLPYTIEFACIQWIALHWNKRGSEHLAQEDIGPLKYQYLSNMPRAIKDIINYHRQRILV